MISQYQIQKLVNLMRRKLNEWHAKGMHGSCCFLQYSRVGLLTEARFFGKFARKFSTFGVQTEGWASNTIFTVLPMEKMNSADQDQTTSGEG